MYLHISVFSILFGYFLFCVTGCTVWTSSLTWHQEAWNESTPTVMWPHRHQTQHRWRHHTCASNVSVSLKIWCDNNPRLQCNLVTRQQKELAWFHKEESMEKTGGGGGGGVSRLWLSTVSALSQAADTFSPTPDICYTRLLSFGNNYYMF